MESTSATPGRSGAFGGAGEGDNRRAHGDFAASEYASGADWVDDVAERAYASFNYGGGGAFGDQLCTINGA